MLCIRLDVNDLLSVTDYRDRVTIIKPPSTKMVSQVLRPLKWCFSGVMENARLENDGLNIDNDNV